MRPRFILLGLAAFASLIAITGCPQKNHPPEVVAAPSGPASGRTGVDCLFWASATDPDDDDKVAVRFDWGDGDTSNWSGFVPSGDSAGKTRAYATPGTFFVRAQARDLDRAQSDWSSACSVVVLLDSNLPPQTPSVPSGPYYGQVYSTYTFSSLAVDPDNDSVCIRFAWGDGDTSTWSWSVPSGDSAYAYHYFTSADTYEIKTQAKDEGGRLSGWSEPHVFVVTTSGNEPPNTPATPSGPSSGRTGMPCSFTSSATDPDWDDVSIRFYWGDGDTSAWSAYVWSGDDVTMSHTYADSGTFLVTAQAKDEDAYTSAWSVGHQISIILQGPTPWVFLNNSGPKRSGMGCAYDPTRNRLVVFGGDDSTGYTTGETWEWDGAEWQLVSSSGPGARYAVAMTYDEERGNSFLYGGWTEPDNYLDDTWVWDGVQWDQTVVSGPSARANVAMAYDSRRQRVVMFGGSYYTTAIGETWEWDGTQWELRSTTGPSARIWSRMTYDSRRGKCILFGGETGYYSGTRPLDTWEWDGSSWVRVDTGGPSGRINHIMTYDSLRGRTVLFGGRSRVASPYDLYSDTWEWDGVSWALVATGGPSARSHGALFFHDSLGKVVLYGGATDQQTMGDMWLYSPTGRGAR
jgi:hypothetical protein